MRTTGRLSFNAVKNAKPGPDGKAVMLCDGGNLWLEVRVGKHGHLSKSWIFRYAAEGTKISQTGREYRRERQMGLGPLHTVGLAEAREKARDARLLLLAGKDPLDEKNAQVAARRTAQARRLTFADAAKAYLSRFEHTWKNAAHRRQWHDTLQDYVLPALGQMDVAAISTDQVLGVLEPIWATVPETASRVRGRIETVLSFAGRSEGNPARWKGHLEHKLAKRNKVRTVKHLAALPYTEIAAFMSELRAANSIPARALEITILTACRSNEVIGAMWGEFDLAKRLWTIPASRTKRDKEHAVPLPDACVAILEAMAAAQQGGRVFPIGQISMRRCLLDIQPGVTVHGFRSTFRSWAGACTTHPRDVCEAALGHAVGNAVEQSYMRDALLAKRRVLMADWADFCAGGPNLSAPPSSTTSSTTLPPSSTTSSTTLTPSSTTSSTTLTP
jgi:integrase